jgi:hypothetical protein
METWVARTHPISDKDLKAASEESESDWFSQSVTRQ